MDLRDISVAGRVLANFPDARMTGPLPSPDYTAMVVPSRQPHRNLILAMMPGVSQTVTKSVAIRKSALSG